MPTSPITMSKALLLQRLRARLASRNAEQTERAIKDAEYSLVQATKNLADAKARLKRAKTKPAAPPTAYYNDELRTAITTLECIPLDQIPINSKALKIPFHLL